MEQLTRPVHRPLSEIVQIDLARSSTQIEYSKNHVLNPQILFLKLGPEYWKSLFHLNSASVYYSLHCNSGSASLQQQGLTCVSRRSVFTEDYCKYCKCFLAKVSKNRAYTNQAVGGTERSEFSNQSSEHECLRPLIVAPLFASLIVVLTYNACLAYKQGLSL